MTFVLFIISLHIVSLMLKT